MTVFKTRCSPFSARGRLQRTERGEPGILPLKEGDTEGRVMDLVAADPDGGPRLLMDVTFTYPLRSPAESAVQ
jgi:hypothetical protein